MSEGKEYQTKAGEIRAHALENEKKRFSIGKHIAEVTDESLTKHSPLKCPERTVTHSLPDSIVTLATNTFVVNVNTLTFTASPSKMKMYCVGHQQEICNDCIIKEKGIKL